MSLLHFTWDAKKDRANQRKHGVSFEEAKSVFYDEYARLIGDPEHSLDEERFALLGMSAQLKVLVVCHCYRDSQGEVRVISARKATKKERHQYEGFLP